MALLLLSACSGAEKVDYDIDYPSYCDGDVTEVYACDRHVRTTTSFGMEYYYDGLLTDCEAEPEKCDEIVHEICERKVICQPDMQNSLFYCDEVRPEMCTMEYDPVCAQVDTGVRCITEPCDSFELKTYSNGCSACADARVTVYRLGAC